MASAHGEKLSFISYLKIAFPLMILSNVELPFFQLKVDVFENLGVAVFKNFRNVFEFDNWFFQLS